MQRSSCGGPAGRLAAGLLLVLVLAPGARGVEPAPGIYQGEEPVGQEVEAILAPVIPLAPEEILAPEVLTYEELAPVAGGDRPSLITDASRMGLRGPLTALERAKLEMARQAIEASRAAGTLYTLPEDAVIYSAEEAEAIKLQRLRATEPAELPADPAAAVGIEIPSVQVAGAPGLTPAEEAKLRGEAPSAPQPAPPAREIPASGREEGR